MRETIIKMKSKKAQRIITLFRAINTHWLKVWISDKEMIIEAWQSRAEELQEKLDKVQILLNTEKKEVGNILKNEKSTDIKKLQKKAIIDFQDYYQNGNFDDERTIEWNIDNFLNRK